MMKKIISVFAFAALFACLAVAQDAEKQETTGGPEMKFETMTMDYGTIEQNSEPYREFNFTNVGDEPLQITNAKGSCGCTVPEWPKEPIFPGESDVIKVRYDTKRIGKFAKTITLTTNSKADNAANGTLKLTIKGEVLKPAAEPEGVPAAAPSILGGGN